MSLRHSARSRIGIAHPDADFRRGVVGALDARECTSWSPGELPDELRSLDVVVVMDSEGASQALRHWPRASLLRWGRPDTTPMRWSWDGWIDCSLGAPEAANVLLELLDSGLLGRNHGPLSNPEHRSPKRET